MPLRFGARGSTRLNRTRGGSAIDFGTYGSAIVLLGKNPSLALAPLLMGITSVLLAKLFPGYGNDPFSALNTGLAGLISMLLQSFGLAVSIVIADSVWRYGKAPFDTAWEEARRKAPEILMAALGFNFVLWAAMLVAGYVLPWFGILIAGAIALFFFIYTLPAAAIGGIPGGAALQVSLERARRKVPNTLLLEVVYIVSYYVLPELVLAYVLPHLRGPAVLASIVSTMVQSIFVGYVALVLAKGYNDASYGRF